MSKAREMERRKEGKQSEARAALRRSMRDNGYKLLYGCVSLGICAWIGLVIIYLLISSDITEQSGEVSHSMPVFSRIKRSEFLHLRTKDARKMEKNMVCNDIAFCLEHLSYSWQPTTTGQQLGHPTYLLFIFKEKLDTKWIALNETRQLSNDKVMRDPLESLRKYRGAYGITNVHYWSSTAYAGTARYLLGALWLLCGVVFGIYLLVTTCCKRSTRLKKIKKPTFHE